MFQTESEDFQVKVSLCSCWALATITFGDFLIKSARKILNNITVSDDTLSEAETHCQWCKLAVTSQVS